MATQKIERPDNSPFLITYDAIDDIWQMSEKVNWIDYMSNFRDFLKKDDFPVEHFGPNISQGTKCRVELTILSGHEFFPFWRFRLVGKEILRYLEKKGWRPANVREFLTLLTGQRLRISHLYALGSRWTNAAGEIYVPGLKDDEEDFNHKELSFMKFNVPFCRDCFFLVAKKQQ